MDNKEIKPVYRRIAVACLLSLLLLTLQGCGSSIFINAHYAFKAKSAPLLAILPVGSTPNFSDSVFVRVFADSIGSYQLIPPGEIRVKMLSNPALLKTIDSILAKDDSEVNLQSNPNISNLISKDGIQLLRFELSQANLMLVPVTFRVSSTLRHVFGGSRFRLYDLNSGQLIYEKNYVFEVETIETNWAETRMTALLVAHAFEDFQRHYLDRINSAHGR